MQFDTSRFLSLVERADSLAFLDIEASGLRGDYHSVLCVSIKSYKGRPFSFSCAQPGNDQKVVREARDALESFDCWVTYYGKGFDIPMLNTRLMKWVLKPIEKRPHIDMYYVLKYNLLTARKSQAHLLEWLDTPEKKMTVSAEMWNKIMHDPETMKTMIKRCESDVKGLQNLYERTKHVIADIKK